MMKDDKRYTRRTAGFPSGWIVNNGRIDAHHVFSLRDKELPPCILDILFEFRTQWSVIEKARIAIVNFRRGKNETTSFAKAHNFVHVIFYGQGLDLGFFLRVRRRRFGSFGFGTCRRG